MTSRTARICAYIQLALVIGMLPLATLALIAGMGSASSFAIVWGLSAIGIPYLGFAVSKVLPNCGDSGL